MGARMKNQIEVLGLDKDWWKRPRTPSTDVIISKPPKRQFIENRNYKVSEIAEQLNCSVDTVYGMVGEGLITQPLVKQFRILGSDINDYLYERWKRKKVG